MGPAGPRDLEPQRPESERFAWINPLKMWRMIRAGPSRTSRLFCRGAGIDFAAGHHYPVTAGSFGTIKRLIGGLQHQIGAGTVIRERWPLRRKQ